MLGSLYLIICFNVFDSFGASCVWQSQRLDTCFLNRINKLTFGGQELIYFSEGSPFNYFVFNAFYFLYLGKIGLVFEQDLCKLEEKKAVSTTGFS